MQSTSQPIFHWPTGSFLEASPSSRAATCSRSDAMGSTVQVAQAENRQKESGCPGSSSSDVALWLTETESCLKLARAVCRGSRGWDQAFSLWSPSPPGSAGRVGSQSSLFWTSCWRFPALLGNPVSCGCGCCIVLPHLGDSLSYRREGCS